MPARVLMQDLTGVPAVVDLAAMRSAMARNGGDPSKVDPLVPADLIIDHSVQVDLFRTEGAYAANIEWEYKRNAERYALLRWAQQAFDGLRVVPPGAGICHQVNLEHLGQVVTVRDGVAFPDTLVGTDSHTTMINGLGVLGWGVGGIEAEAAMLGPADVPAAAARDRRPDDGELASRHHRDRPGAHAHPDAPRARRGRPLRRVLRRRAVHALDRRPRDALQHVSRVRGNGLVLPGRCRDAPLPVVHRPRRRSSTWSSATPRSRGCSGPTATRTRCSPRCSTSTSPRWSRRSPDRSARRTASRSRTSGRRSRRCSAIDAPSNRTSSGTARW